MRTLASAFLLTSLCLHPPDVEGQSNTAVPMDFFTGITLDAAVNGPFQSYVPIHFSGTVSDPLVTDVQFVVLFNDHEIVANCTTLNWYLVPVRDRKFRHTLFFSHEQTGDYLLQMRTKRGGSPYDPAGVFRHFVVVKGPETSPIPTGFFADIELSAPIPVEITTGQAVRVAGEVFDSSLTMVGLSFIRDDVDYGLTHNAPVLDGRFARTLFFPHKTAGVYRLVLRRYHGNMQTSAPQDIFSPVRIIRGEGTAFLPSDFFEEVTLSSPLPVVLTPGRKLRVTGTVSDPSVSQIDFLFWIPGGYLGQSRGKTDAYFKAAVNDGQFTIRMDFSPKQQTGDYWLGVFLHRRGQRSQGPRAFRPITIEQPPSPDFNRDGTVGFADFVVFAAAFGRTIVDDDSNSRFDLNGDGTVDFGDFVIFARAFGR